MPQTYSSYLKLEDILKAQKPLSSEHDEMLFIVIHQVYELWFKQIVYETTLLQKKLETGQHHACLCTLNRILKILKTMVSQIDILETMTPISFSSFRKRLETSSGFQSFQFRELEFLLGRKNEKMIDYHKENKEHQKKLQEAFKKATLLDSFFSYLNQQENLTIPKKVLERDFKKPYEENEEVKTILKKYTRRVYHLFSSVRLL